MVFGIFAFLAALTLPVPAAHPPSVHRRATPGPPQRRSGPKDLAAGDLYSARARRRLTGYLRLRLLELRKLGLERAADAVERRLPVDELLRRQ